MSSEQPSVVSGAHGLLRGQRAKSYGSLVTSCVAPVRQKRVQHEVQPGETLQGLALTYGVSMEQIKRANRLYTNDSIFLKKVLSIPVLSESLAFTTNDNGLHEEDSSLQRRKVPVENGQTVSESQEAIRDISPSDFLKRMDTLINQSKQAALKTCQEGDQQFFSADLVRCSSEDTCSSTQGQQAMLGSVPLTITKRSKKLRDTEDEIFHL